MCWKQLHSRSGMSYWRDAVFDHASCACHVQMRSKRNFCIDIILVCILLGIVAYVVSLVQVRSRDARHGQLATGCLKIRLVRICGERTCTASLAHHYNVVNMHLFWRGAVCVLLACQNYMPPHIVGKAKQYTPYSLFSPHCFLQRFPFHIVPLQKKKSSS